VASVSLDARSPFGMPRKSERGEYLEEIGRLQESVLLHENGEKRRKLFNQLMRLEIEVCSHRYLERPTKYKQTRTTSRVSLSRPRMKRHRHRVC